MRKEFYQEDYIWDKLVNSKYEVTSEKLSYLEDKTILFIGDSITVEPRGNYVGYLSLKLSNYIDISTVNIVNTGVPSDATVNVLDRLPDVLEETTPDICLVALGVNDCKYLRKIDRTLIDRQSFEANMKAIIKRIKTECNPKIILTTLSPIDYRKVLNDEFWKNHYYWSEETVNTYSDSVIKVAAETGALIANTLSAFYEFDYPRLLFKDGVHPNALGHVVIAATIFSTFLETI
jgi:lysophospholipase L1-like esterase